MAVHEGSYVETCGAVFDDHDSCNNLFYVPATQPVPVPRYTHTLGFRHENLRALISSHAAACLGDFLWGGVCSSLMIPVWNLQLSVAGSREKNIESLSHGSRE